MSGILNHVIRLALSLSLMDRDLFIKNVSEILERYKNDPEQMEKIAAGIYTYLEEVKNRMDTKAVIHDAIDASKIPSKEQITELSDAINKLAEEIRQQKQQS
jgi:DNA-binding transcriptional MerR regulator